MENQSERQGDMMHPQFRADLLHERSPRLDLDVRRSYLLNGTTQPAPIDDEEVSLRLGSVHDDPALDRLAVLEGLPSPRGRVVLADANGTIVPARPLSGDANPLA